MYQWFSKLRPCNSKLLKIHSEFQGTPRRGVEATFCLLPAWQRPLGDQRLPACFYFSIQKNSWALPLQPPAQGVICQAQALPCALCQRSLGWMHVWCFQCMEWSSSVFYNIRRMQFSSKAQKLIPSSRLELSSLEATSSNPEKEGTVEGSCLLAIYSAAVVRFFRSVLPSV